MDFRSLEDFGSPCLAARHRADDQKRFGACGHCRGQQRVRGLMRPILPTGEEAHERTALLRGVIADRPPQHRIRRLQSVQDRTLGDWPFHLQLDLFAYVSQRPQICPLYTSRCV